MTPPLADLLLAEVGFYETPFVQVVKSLVIFAVVAWGLIKIPVAAARRGG